MLFNICLGNPEGLDGPFKIVEDKWKVRWLEKEDTGARIRIAMYDPIEVKTVSKLRGIQRYDIGNAGILTLNRKNTKAILVNGILDKDQSEEYIFCINVPDNLKILDYDTQYRIVYNYSEIDKFKTCMIECRGSEIDNDHPIMSASVYNAQKECFMKYDVYFTKSDTTNHKISIKCTDSFTKAAKKEMQSKLIRTRGFGKIFRYKFNDGDKFVSTIITTRKTDAMVREFAEIPDSKIIEVQSRKMDRSTLNQLESILRPERIMTVILDGVEISKADAREIGIRNAFQYNGGKAITQLTLK